MSTRSATTDNQRLMAAAAYLTAVRVLTEIDRLTHELDYSERFDVKRYPGASERARELTVEHQRGDLRGLRFAASALAGALLLPTDDPVARLREWIAEADA